MVPLKLRKLVWLQEAFAPVDVLGFHSELLLDEIEFGLQRESTLLGNLVFLAL